MNWKNSLILLCGLCIFVSCTEYIELDLNTDENVHLVVEGLVTNELKKHTVKLTYTTNYFDDKDIAKVSGAKVIVSDSKNTYTFHETEFAGIYESPEFAATEGETYRLDIELENGEAYFAESYLKEVVPIDSIKSSGEYVHPWYRELGYDVYLYMQEPVGRGDAYLWDMYFDTMLITDTLRKKQFGSDLNFEGQYIRNYQVFWISSEYVQDDTLNVSVKMSRFEQHYFDYILSIFLETDFRGGMFDGPPANVNGNLSNGALGYFLASSVSFAEMQIIRQKTLK